MRRFHLHPPISRRLAGAVFGLAAIVLALGATAQPTVNGLFYGDGDDALYQPYAVSEYGSVLYSYLDISTLTLYVALVVDHDVNDMVCSPKGNKVYTQSAQPPWTQGSGRDCNRATDSEFAEFSLECAPGSPNSWTWQQATGCPTVAGPPDADWVSDSTCGPSSLASEWPPGVEANASTSWVANVNTYQDAVTARGWNMYTLGNQTADWNSPFVASAPNDVTQVPGYPTYSGSNFQWEWSVVYEWSVDLGPGGADCGNEAIFFVTGNSHHSPSKVGDENDDFPPPSDPRLSDWGDNPDSYSTTSAAGGPQHYIKVTGPYLGTSLQTEINGQPTADATGDGDEEDGVTAVVDDNWAAGSTQSIEVVVGNADGGAVLAGWFDWNGDGDFDDPGEYFTWNVTTGTQTLNVTVGADFDWQNDGLYSRFRIFSAAAAAPGGSLTQADFAGTATDGEVEDYFFEIGSLPVTLHAFHSDRTADGDVVVRWQTASETDNVGFEVWGRVDGRWQPVSDLVASHSLSSGVPQDYEVSLSLPSEVTQLRLVDHDSRGRQGRFGAFRVGGGYGEFQSTREIDWSGPRREREERLLQRGFSDTAAHGSRAAGQEPAQARRWKKIREGRPLAAGADRRSAAAVEVEVAASRGGRRGAGTETRTLAAGASTHLAVTEDGVQRVTYEALRDGGLDLAGVQARDVAVTWRGEPVARWIGGPSKIGPGSVLEFVGRAPRGSDALYIDANLYQVAVDPAHALEPAQAGVGRAKNVPPSYFRTARWDPPTIYRGQSPTGDPWVENSLLVRSGRTTALTLDLPVDGPVAEGPATLLLGLGTLTDLPDRRDAQGHVIPEHNVEVWFRGAGGVFAQVATAATRGRGAWTVEAQLPDGWLESGLNQVELHFTTGYFYSLVVVDDWEVRYPTPYRGPSLDFAADFGATGYRITGFTTPDVVAWAQGDDGWTRLMPRVERDGPGYAAELRQADGGHYWVTETPQRPEVFTTEAPGDLLAEPGDLVVIAGSSFVGSRALDDYVAQHADLDPVVIDVEDLSNAVGYGMALPSAITDYLRMRDAVYPFSQVQLVGTDCYDRLNHISQCVSFLPLPTAPVGANAFTPSQNRLADLDGDGVADKAIAQFSVRDEAELATIVGKGEAWRASGQDARDTALFIAEETDGLHDFLGQVDRLRQRLGWSDSEVLDLAAHPRIQTARQALTESLEDGRTVTVFSGHSSPTVWSFRGLVTGGTAAALGNDGKPTLMVPLACETTYDVSPSANVLGHQLLYASDAGALAISGAAALSSLEENERMANHVLAGLEAGLSLGEAVQRGREALGTAHQELQDNWLIQGDVATGLER